MEGNHCKDCCCAQSWKALGITEYTGKSIPEHINELVKANEWQDIETAPKDGTRIILGWVDSGNVWCDCYWEKMARVPDRWGSFVGIAPKNPTHWMPTPIAPTGKK